MVIIQQNTHKIVVVFETQKKYWFFPRGRKDIGESLEKAALREAYEEVRILPYFVLKTCSE
jgi:ADP-ribose pyrophosphatase YjhB (NUDIX family)